MVSYLDDEVLLAAVGIGNMMKNMFALAIMYGMNTALETLVAQANGA